MKAQISSKITLITVVIFCPFFAAAGAVLAVQSDNSNAKADESVVDPEIEAVLKPVIENEELIPGIVAAIVHEGKPIRIAAAGVRKLNSAPALDINDKMHLGSCTKAMTATVIGRLMDQEKISLDWTIGEALPEFIKKVHEDYADVTLRQLLQHRSGLPSNAKWWMSAGENLSERRQLIAIASLQNKPDHPPGSNYQYSNLGYVVAGLMAAQAGDSTWEELMQEEVFGPLRITSAGFGIPGNVNEIVQPWGHRLHEGKPMPIHFDNPPAIGPAGSVHMNLNDWGKFALAHAAGSDKGYLTNETLRALHEPAEESDYALGWGVSNRPWAGGTTLAHSGSNTNWFCTVWLAPKKQVAYLVATNVAGGKVPEIVDGVIGELIKIDQE